MSWLSNIGKAVKKGVVDTGHTFGKIQSNPWVQGLEAAGLTATGVGAPAAAALLAGSGALAGAVKEHGGIKQVLPGAAQGALTGGIGGLAGKAAGALPGMISGGIGGIPGQVGGFIKDHAGDIGGAIGGIGSAVGGGGGLGKALDLGLGTAGMLNASKLQGQSTDYAKDALGTVQKSYDERAPLRMAGVQQMLHPTLTSDPSQLNQVARRNPFAPKALPFNPAASA